MVHDRHPARVDRMRSRMINGWGSFAVLVRSRTNISEEGAVGV
jgi:hypothetical protein